MRIRLFVGEEYKPLRLVPPSLWLLTVAACLGQLGFHHYFVPPPTAIFSNLKKPPSVFALRVSSLGESATLAKVLALRLQSHDNQGSISVSFRDLDYDLMGIWLDRIVALDERAEYPHFLMSKVYSGARDNERKLKAAAWTKKHFLQDPNNRWEWMVHMTNVVRYIVKDDALALALAKDIRRHTIPGKVPSWVRQIEALFYNQQDEFEAAAKLFESQLENGEVWEPQEFKFSRDRLEGILKKMHKRGALSADELQAKINRLDILTDKFLQQHAPAD